MSVHSLIVQSIGHLVQVHDAQPPWRPSAELAASHHVCTKLIDELFEAFAGRGILRIDRALPAALRGDSGGQAIDGIGGLVGHPLAHDRLAVGFEVRLVDDDIHSAHDIVLVGLLEVLS